VPEALILDSPDLDDQTVAYILDAQKHFEDLRQVASQLAGVLVLAAAGGKTATPDHPMLRAAGQLHRSAADGIRGARSTARTRQHHLHLLAAMEKLAAALTTARTGLEEVGPILNQLRAAYDSLRSAAASLPGFKLMEFDHGCCALKTTP
jgi:hypothetical protein